MPYMKNLAIIPARSGSKGMKDKNIKNLNGKPLMSYSIEAAIKSKRYSEIMVSTDSEIYADIALEYGAKVPFLRSKSLATDKTSSWEVVLAVLQYYSEKGIDFDTISLLQPTSPLRTEDDINAGFRIMEEKSADTVVSVCEVEHLPLWMNTLPEDNSMKDFINVKLINTTRQKLDKYYRLNGAIYIIKTEYLLNNLNIYGDKSYAIIMPKERSVDIDDEIDFLFAETLIRNSL